MKKTIIASMIGNTLEWYDFALFGHFAFVIGKLFFPKESEIIQMIMTFGIFSAGFLMRPLGAIIFGIIGDKYGRRYSLSVSIILMGIPTALIGVLPTYEKIGIIAPIILICIRLLQGISMGGEMGGAMTFIIEHSPSTQRGFIGSCIFASTCMGMLLGSVIATIFSKFLPEAEFMQWGWRAPFLLGVIISAVGYYIRRNLLESEIYSLAKKNNKFIGNPIKEIAKNFKSKILMSMAANLSMAVPFFMLIVFFNNFMKTSLHFESHISLLIVSINILIIIAILPLAGKLSDIYGRKKVLILSSMLMMLIVYPCMQEMNSHNYIHSAIAQFILSISIGLYCGPVFTVIVEMFPTLVRYSGVSLAMNINTAVFGSTIPLLGGWLIKNYGDDQAISYLAVYIILCNIVSIIGTSRIEDIYQQELR